MLVRKDTLAIGGAICYHDGAMGFVLKRVLFPMLE